MYWSSVFLLPKAVIKMIEGKMREFLWTGATGVGHAKVAWVQVCRSKEEGGLGIRSIIHMNQALMLKHVWRILQEDPQSIWVSWVLRHRLRKQTIWTHNSASVPWYWKKIIKVSGLIKHGLDYRVGDGCKFRLWNDLWHPRGPLIHSFPRGPAITGLSSDSLLREVLLDGQWRWPSETDFDVQEIIAALPLIHQHQSDEIHWKVGKFTTSAVLSFIQPSSSRVSWHLLLGGKFHIPRHDFILWLAILEHLSTMDRSWVQCPNSSCILCGGQHVETHSHSFFECTYSKRCMDILQRLVRFQWVHNGWQRSVMWATRRWRGNHLLNSASRAVFAATVILSGVSVITEGFQPCHLQQNL
ncbi:UNVERIFIED_CONTAM: hypothetical protein Sradi_7065200 [Sesamum radiatum]|uniref:Reverse transcriptase zinc-binding domain-containing protein n=1 Tax=Sesamum radiatum TaxID=300843 RepID=A0AAW2J671_SESRA